MFSGPWDGKVSWEVSSGLKDLLLCDSVVHHGTMDKNNIINMKRMNHHSFIMKMELSLPWLNQHLPTSICYREVLL